MTGEEWFRLWMTLLQAFGGGLVTLGGVYLGWRFANRSAKQERWNAELNHWINELSRIHRHLLDADPKTQQEASDAISAAMVDLIRSHKSRPTPRGSVGDALISSLFLAIGALAGLKPEPPSIKVPREPGPPESIDPDADYFRTVYVLDRLLTTTLELALTWNKDGLSQRKINRAEKTRREQIGGGYIRVPDDRKSGPSSKYGGWA
ncbi:hypothetical protein [Nocardia thraciensis]